MSVLLCTYILNSLRSYIIIKINNCVLLQWGKAYGTSNTTSITFPLTYNAWCIMCPGNTIHQNEQSFAMCHTVILSGGTVISGAWLNSGLIGSANGAKQKHWFSIGY